MSAGLAPMISALVVENIDAMGIKAVKANVVSETNWVRHDPLKLSRTIVSMIYKLKTNSERMRLLDYYLIAENIKDLKKNEH